MNTKVFVILTITIMLILIGLFMNKTKKERENFVDIEKEYFNNNSNISLCQTTNDMCNNFMNCCVKDQNSSCKKVDLVACQKYKLKCESHCKSKQIDDNGKKQKDLKKCNETCKKVQQDCCRRLNQ